MKKTITTTLLVVLTATSLTFGQAPPAQPPTGQKTLAATMNVYAFPSKGQEASQQSQDEAACYTWAVQNTGTDPFTLQKQAQQQQQQAEAQKQQIAQAGKGAGAAGAVGGAAAGALIGEVASDNAGAGAAYGAAAGAIIARRRTREKKEQATQQVEQQSQQVQAATQQQIDNFKKAFSVCLEGKNYLVKY